MLTIAFILVFVFGTVIGGLAMALAAISSQSDRRMQHKP